MYKYFLSMIIFFIIPGIIFFIIFKNKRKAMAYTSLLILIIAIISDYVGMYLRLWELNEAELLGFIFGLPVDDIFYTIFLGLFVLGIYEIVGKYLGKKSSNKI